MVSLTKTAILPELKAKFLIHHFSQFSGEEITELIRSIGGGYEKLASKDDVEASIPNNEFNEKFLTAIMAEGIIDNIKRSTRKLAVELKQN